MAIVFDSDAGTITGLSVGGLPDGTVDAGTLATDSVTAAKIATDSVTAAKIAANSVDSAELVDGAVDDSHMASISGRKNIFINGAFDVSQRGYSSATAVSNDDYTLDRWKMRIDGASATVQQTAVTPWTGKTTNAIKVVATSTANGYHNIRQIVEDYKIVSGQTVTLSAWVRGSGNPLFFRHWGVTNIGSGKALTSSWQKYTETYNVPALSNTTDGNSGSFTMALGNYNGNVSITSGDYYEVALFQVELGSVATDFEQRSYGEELALCQRYYEIASGGSYGAFPTTSNYRVSVPYKVTKRASPTIAVLASSENCCSSVTAMGGHEDATAGGRVQGTNVFVTSSASKYFYAKFSAESEL